MKDCDKVRCLYSVCLEGEASVADMTYFNDHMSACRDCRSDYTTFTATSGLLRTLPRIEVSAGFDDGVLARVRAMSAVPASTASDPVEISLDRRWWEGWFPRLAAVGSLAALALVVTLTMKGDPAGKTPGAEANPQPLAANKQEITTLEQLYPDLSPEMLQSMQNLTRDGVIDRMVIRSGSPNGDMRMVTPVGSEGPVYVSF